MEDSTPELYADGVQIGLGPFGTILSFTMQPAGQTGTLAPIRVCNLRMSLEHAKVLAMLLRKQIKIDFDRAKLDGQATTIQQKDDIAKILISFALPSEHLQMNALLVKLLEGWSHVALMDEQ